MRATTKQAVACVIASSVVAAVTPSLRAAPPEFRGLWVEAWHEGFKSTAEIDALISRAVAGHYNAILAEMLSYHDNALPCHGAYWNSSIVPKATDIVGDIDPLAYLVEQAHAHSLQVHAWLITYRVSLAWPPTGNPTLQAHPEWIMTTQASLGGGPSPIDTWYTLDAGSPDVQEYLISIVRELVTNYSVDGVLWDRIRYASVDPDTGYPAYLWYQGSGLARFQRITGFVGTPARTYGPWNDFRRREITELVRRARAELPSIRSNPRQPLRHGAMLLTTGNAPVSFSGSAAWRVFQNWEEWMRLGLLDTAFAMTYYDDEQYPDYYRHWVDRELSWRYQRNLVVGVELGMNTFENSIIQMQYAKIAGADGLSTDQYYDTKKPYTNDWAWYPYVGSTLFASPAALPAMSWRDPATATEGTLWGRVTDGSTGRPIDDACVRVGSLDAVQTDGNGYYTATLIPASSSGSVYKVLASKTGYPGRLHEGVQVVAGDIRRDDLVLGGSPVAPPVLTHQPQPQAVAPGSAATFTAAAAGPGPLAWQWQRKDLDLEDGGVYSGVHTPTLVIAGMSSEQVGTLRCMVTNAGGTTFSCEAALTLPGSPGSEFIVESRPGGWHFADYSEMGVTYDSSSLAMKSTAAGTTSGIGTRWTSMNRDASGPSHTVYRFTPTSTGLYEVFVTWPSSSNASSRVEHLVTHVCGASSVFMDQNNASNPSGANNWNSLGQYYFQGASSYTVTQTNENSPDAGYIMRADAVKWRLISAEEPAVFVGQPASQSLCPGQTAVFTVATTAQGILSYQWQKDGASLSDSGHYSGVNAPILTVSGVDAADVGFYSCRVRANCVVICSDTAALTLDGPNFARADFNQDGYVDQVDFGHFQLCLSGAAPQDSADCQDARLDGKPNVDDADLAIFLRCMSGPGTLADRCCAH